MPNRGEASYPGVVLPALGEFLVKLSNLLIEETQQCEAIFPDDMGDSIQRKSSELALSTLAHPTLGGARTEVPPSH